MRTLQTQVEAGFNRSWTKFDLAQACLFSGDAEKFLRYVAEGIAACMHAHVAAGDLLDTLKLLTEAGIVVPGLETGKEKLQEAVDYLPA